MDQLVSELGNVEIIPNEWLLFELFDIHKHLNNEGGKYETFEDFISFGEMMMADFSELDLYCVDAQEIFANLHDLKSIGEWDIETGKLTPFQERYLRFYKSLYQYYTQLHQRLQKRNRAYSGMAYRIVAEHIEELSVKESSEHLYFVGFNALSTSEDRIISHFVKGGKGSILTDGDAYYVNDIQQEAGFFLRKHRVDYPSIKEFPDHFAIGKKEINIISCPENVLQCKHAGEILSEHLNGDNANTLGSTAIVLGDESLLLPTLNSLPPQIKAANITMGFPFPQTSAHSLMLKIISLQQRRRDKTFYYQDIIDILTDIFVLPLTGITNISQIEELFYRDKIIYAGIETLDNLISQMGGQLGPIKYLFTADKTNPDELLGIAKQLIQTIYLAQSLESDIREKESLACLLQMVNYLQDLQEEYHCLDSLTVLQKIYVRLSKRNSIAFYGEPLEGLQILGVLETRNLDFKHVIMLSANEGTIPSGKKHNSLIPYNLRVHFGLPTFHEKDAVYAYNFYRLIQRAESIEILYNTESEGIGKGEPSRFVLQLQNELAKKYPNISIHEKVLSSMNDKSYTPMQDVGVKNDVVMDRLQHIAEKGFSPSALNKYRDCPLRYYYENVLRIEESNQVSEDLEQNELGTCIHSVLENIYSKEPDHIVRKETLQEALANLDTLIEQSLNEQFQYGRNRLGRNMFMESVAKIQISKFLKMEISQLDQGSHIEIVGLEKELSHKLECELRGKKYEVNIAGTADRIDCCDGFFRIIDYKSGKCDSKELVVREAEPDVFKVSDKWFQIMLYEWLFHKSTNGDKPHVSGIYPLQHSNTQLMTASWENETVITSKHLSIFETMLKGLINEIMDPEIDFEANKGCKSCNYCSFKECCELQ